MKSSKITPADVVIFVGIAVNVVVIALILYYFVL
jgi:preprotein translocase subunit Sec61beta